jgi:hypothetical protein
LNKIAPEEIPARFLFHRVAGRDAASMHLPTGTLQSFFQKVGKAQAGLVQFFPDDICHQRSVTNLVRLRFFIRLACRDDTILLLLRCTFVKFNRSCASRAIGKISSAHASA